MQVNRDNPTDKSTQGIDVDTLKAAQSVTQRIADVRDMFRIDDMFETFMRALKMDIRKMPPFQVKLAKTAFVGGVGHILTLSKMQLYDNFNQDESDKILSDIMHECNDYLEKNTTLTHGKKRNATIGKENTDSTNSADKGGN